MLSERSKIAIARRAGAEMGREKHRDQKQTIRQEMIALLTQSQMTTRELSRVIGIREREVYEHLPHIARSVVAQRKKLVFEPFQCLVCGYVFQDRKRFTRPSRCPRCKESRLQEPTYRVSHP